MASVVVLTDEVDTPELVDEVDVIMVVGVVVVEVELVGEVDAPVLVDEVDVIMVVDVVVVEVELDVVVQGGRLTELL